MSIMSSATLTLNAILYTTLGSNSLPSTPFFLLLPAAPSSPPRSVAISAVTSTGFLVSWSAPPTVDHNGNIRSYLLNLTEENTGDSVQFTSNTNSLRVESRHPYYNYTCVVAAVTVAAGPFSTPATVTTLEDGKTNRFLCCTGL